LIKKKVLFVRTVETDPFSFVRNQELRTVLFVFWQLFQHIQNEKQEKLILPACSHALHTLKKWFLAKREANRRYYYFFMKYTLKHAKFKGVLKLLQFNRKKCCFLGCYLPSYAFNVVFLGSSTGTQQAP